MNNSFWSCPYIWLLVGWFIPFNFFCKFCNSFLVVSNFHIFTFFFSAFQVADFILHHYSATFGEEIRCQISINKWNWNEIYFLVEHLRVPIGLLLHCYLLLVQICWKAFSEWLLRNGQCSERCKWFTLHDFAPSGKFNTVHTTMHKWW